MVTDSRRVPLQGASNFRDLGGYAAAAGLRVRRGQVYRSDHLGQLTAGDVAHLQALNLSRVLDFRGEREWRAGPSTLPGVAVQGLSIEPTVVQRISEHLRLGQTLAVDQVAEFMRQTYRDFVHLNSPRFAQFFVALESASGPVVFHCTAGKDRTGLAAALLLHALGVHADDVMADYLLTNQFLVPPVGVGEALTPEVRAVLWGVQPDFLHAAQQAMAERHGGIDAYLRGALGLDGNRLAALRARLLA